MDVGRGVASADGSHGINVVEMTVGEQDGGRFQAVLRQNLRDGVLDADAGVDDQALLPFPGRDHITVGREGLGGEGNGEHDEQA